MSEALEQPVLMTSKNHKPRSNKFFIPNGFRMISTDTISKDKSGCLPWEREVISANNNIPLLGQNHWIGRSFPAPDEVEPRVVNGNIIGTWESSDSQYSTIQNITDWQGHIHSYMSNINNMEADAYFLQAFCVDQQQLDKSAKKINKMKFDDAFTTYAQDMVLDAANKGDVPKGYKKSFYQDTLFELFNAKSKKKKAKCMAKLEKYEAALWKKWQKQRYGDMPFKAIELPTVKPSDQKGDHKKL